jgi:polyisoprenoid-binding protein YceI
MTKIINFGLAAVLAVSSFFACKNESPKDSAANTTPKPDTIRVGPTPSAEGATTYAITEGTVYWAAKKATGSQHNGAIKIKSGSFLIKEGQILSGAVSIDMNSIEVLDLKDPGEKSDLEKHLKDNDFFETNKFPEGTYTFDEVLPSNLPAFNTVIPGSLTLKGKSNQVNIPLKTTLNGNELIAESASFIINRTKWGINFHSGILGTAKDKLIEDNVMVSLTVKAKAQ